MPKLYSFLSLVGLPFQDALPTNVLQAKRGLGSNSSCPRGGMEEEAVLHCLYALEIALILTRSGTR